MKITITGATGFVGRNLSQYLTSQADDVIALSLRDKAYQLNSDADAIIHLAGKAHDTKNTSEESTYYQISSVKAAADTVEGVLTEEVEPNPKTPYGDSKIKAEQYLLSQEFPSGKRVIIIRPCMIHGKGNKGNLNLLYKVVKLGIPWILASYDNRRSFISIDNLNFVIHALLHNSQVASGVYQVADDSAISTNQLITIIAKATHKKPKLVRIPKVMINKLADIGDKFNLPLNSERLQKLTESYVVSNAKIKQALNIDSLPVSAEQGLLQTIKSFQTD